MPTPFRYVVPVTREAASGPVAEVYGQMARDFGLARMPLFMTLSPAPDVLVAAWAALRESLLAGTASRTGKEVVATGVSLANRCPFCVDAHTVLLHATGDHGLAETIARGETPGSPEHARLLAWAQATSGAVAGPAAPAPFPPGGAAEYVGTALAFHFVNRMVSALLTDDFLPGGLQRSRLVRRVGGRAMSRAVRRGAVAGDALPLLEGLPTGPEPGWAEGTPIGRAFAALRGVALSDEVPLGEEAMWHVAGEVARWDGGHPPPGRAAAPPDALPPADRPAARRALLAALAPYRITDADVAAWRDAARGDDADLVRLLAFGAVTAVDRIEAALAPTVPA
ncbi:carboxymuconolactone decarboxylase family protein [Microbispora corallina]|uniref:carboxymuconolactone decarboxylase family protein n=1 Tax=Microbispora corallina TaxID=83302 RepID=UPI0031D9F86C